MSHTIQTLPILILNPHNRCNCRCVMCDIWKRDTVEEIGFDLFRRQIESIERLGVEWVVFTGGEPLMHSDLFPLCAELRKRRIRITLLSSGLLLGRFAQQIAGHIDDVIVSLDGPPEVHDRIRRVPGAFAALASGVARLRELNPSLPVAARCTVQRANCAHLVATVEAARGLGLTSISFLAADTQSDAFNRPDGLGPGRQRDIALNAEDLSTLEAGIGDLDATGACGGFVVESPGKLREIARHFRCGLGMEEPRAPACNAPWVSTVVEADGTVRPCFFHAPVGRIGDGTNLWNVVNGEEATAFRAGLDIASNPICRRCVCSLNRQ